RRDRLADELAGDDTAEHAVDLAVRILDLEVAPRRSGLALLDDVAEVLRRPIPERNGVRPGSRIERVAVRLHDPLRLGRRGGRAGERPAVDGRAHDADARLHGR